MIFPLILYSYYNNEILFNIILKKIIGWSNFGIVQQTVGIMSLID